MNIKLRLALLLGLLLLVFVFCIFAFRALERRQIAEAVAAARRDDAELLENWLDLRSASLRRFLDDTAGWEQLAAFAADPAARPGWARAQLDPLLPNYGVDALWIAGPEGSLRHAIRRAGLPELPLPVPTEHLADLRGEQSGIRTYFHPSPVGLLELRALRFDGPKAPWLFVARVWDPPYLAQLGDLTDSEVSLSPPAAAGIAAALHELGESEPRPAPIAVQRVLPA